MKRNTVGFGGASLMLIFSVLCLAIFAVLTLSSANREKTLTDRLEDSTSAYYAADSAAVEIEAKLARAVSRGETPAEIDGVTINAAGSTFAFACPIDGRRSLAVVLRADETAAGTGLRVLQWRETETANWTPEDQLDVWKGE